MSCNTDDLVGMKSNTIDTVLEVRLRHEPGTLARLAAAIAECEIETLRIGDEQTLREIAAGVVRHAHKTGIAGTAAP